MSVQADGQTLDRVVVIGAGVIGSAIASRLARDGHPVLLLDRAEPATVGASFGNAGHIASEQIEPLPSLRLLLSFWGELTAFGGPLDIPPQRLIALAPWMAGFVRAAFRQHRNTAPLAALVRPAVDTLETALRAIGRSELLIRRGHYSFWRGPRAARRAAQRARSEQALQVRTEPAPAELTRAIEARAGVPAAGLWYPDSAHVLDPRQVALAFVQAAIDAGARFQRTEVLEVTPSGKRVAIRTAETSFTAPAAVVCAGVQSAPLLARFGIHAPLTAERGYHLEFADTAPLIDAPVVYVEESIIITPMQGRLRATSYLEFQRHGSPPDARKLHRLRERLERFGYRSETPHEGWVGSRPTLPDYLPGIGRAPGEAPLFYAVGHQHLGLTLSAPTAEVMGALFAQRTPPLDVRPFDLARFGTRRETLG